MQTINSWFIFQDGQLLLSHENTILNDSPIVIEMKHHFTRVHFVGIFNGVHCYSAEIQANIELPSGLTRQPLRKALDIVETRWYVSIARAASILNWDRTHQFCGCCGQPTEPSTVSLEKYCTHCDLVFYPRISPSVIVLISKGEEILMARSPHFTPGAFGLIAGFVEAGESLENAIHREVKEEVNINVKNIRYFDSQAWPFPDTLMMGFYAEYDSDELIIDNKEIEVAGWYHYSALPGRPSTKKSIASRLIDNFIAQQTKSNKGKTDGTR